jgi:putative SOS response-associated peptidase YedK
MCGRYTIAVTMEELLLRFLIEGPSVPFHQPRYNVAPTQPIPAIVNDGSGNRIGQLRWGLIPSWADDPKKLPLMINARSETLASKRAFRLPFERKRCLIPADSFYEWEGKSGRKQPMRILLKDGGLFSMAGLYDTWESPDGTKVSTCTIITTAPNPLVSQFHDRMPVILRPEDEALWLDRSIRDSRQLEPLLRAYPEAEMRVYPVGRAVNSAKTDTPECIEEELLLL